MTPIPYIWVLVLPAAHRYARVYVSTAGRFLFTAPTYSRFSYIMVLHIKPLGPPLGKQGTPNGRADAS